LAANYIFAGSPLRRAAKSFSVHPIALSLPVTNRSARTSTASPAQEERGARLGSWKGGKNQKGRVFGPALLGENKH
jgi:hypothetical protein